MKYWWIVQCVETLVCIHDHIPKECGIHVWVFMIMPRVELQGTPNHRRPPSLRRRTFFSAKRKPSVVSKSKRLPRLMSARRVWRPACPWSKVILVFHNNTSSLCFFVQLVWDWTNRNPYCCNAINEIYTVICLGLVRQISCKLLHCRPSSPQPANIS